MSILSKELFILAGLLGGVGYVVVADHGAEPAHHAGMSSLRGHEGVIESLAFASDGKTLISCGWDRTVRTWAVGAGLSEWGKEIDTLASEAHLFAVSISPDGRYLAAGGTDSLHLWSSDPDSRWRQLDISDRGSHHALAMSPDGGLLALGCGDGAIKLWEVSGRKEVGVLERFSDELRKIEFSRDGSHLGGTSFAGEFTAWDRSPGSTPRRHPLQPEKVQTFAFAGDSRSVAIAQWSPDLRSLALWDLETGNRVLQFSDNPDGVNALAVSPDGRTLASADVDQSISFWDMSTGKLKARIHEGVGWVKTLAFSPDGRRIAFGGRDCTVQLRELEELGLVAGSDRS